MTATVAPTLIDQLQHLLGVAKELGICAAERDRAKEACNTLTFDLAAVRAEREAAVRERDAARAERDQAVRQCVDTRATLADTCSALDWLKLRREHDAMQGQRDVAHEELRLVRVDLNNVIQHRSRLQVELYEAQLQLKALRDGCDLSRVTRELDETRVALNQATQKEEAARYTTTCVEERARSAAARAGQLEIELRGEIKMLQAQTAEAARLCDRLDQVAQEIRETVR